MTTEEMLTLSGSRMLCVKGKKIEYDIRHLTMLRRMVTAGEYDTEFDFNNDGVLDDIDVKLLRWDMLGKIEISDLIELRRLIKLGAYDEKYDYNADGVLDNTDFDALIARIEEV